MESITIQPTNMEDGTSPYPYHVGMDGLIQRQDFWKGRPFRLIGFAKDKKVNEVNLLFKEWIIGDKIYCIKKDYDFSYFYFNCNHKKGCEGQ